MRRLLMLCALGASACQPNLGAPLSIVGAPRLLGVRAEPPEAPPGASVTWTPLVASRDGPVAQPALDWTLCLQPKASAENDVASPACLTPGGVPFATLAASATVTLPTAGCQLFGPEVPPQTAGQPPFAPRAPDGTGGYYQPVRIDLGAASSIALERIRCSPAGASLDLATQFQNQYVPNRNPRLTTLAATLGGQPIPLDAIPASKALTFVAAWTPDSPETYPVIDALDQVLVSHRESLDVSWYATDGSFADERTGRSNTELELDTSNTWTAPATPGPFHLWLVLRDGRGGLDFSDYALTVVAPPD